MKVCIYTSVSQNIAGIAAVTVPNKFEYCLRHGYTLVAETVDYLQGVAKTASTVWSLLLTHDLVWTLDADAVITNMTIPIHTIDCIGPGVTVCEENIVEWNRINCGSVLWRKGWAANRILMQMSDARDHWMKEPGYWQTWMGRRNDITVVPTRTFNSTAWTHPGNAGVEEPGCHWQDGDFVYHPCGVYPMGLRQEKVELVAKTKVRR